MRPWRILRNKLKDFLGFGANSPLMPGGGGLMPGGGIPIGAPRPGGIPIGGPIGGRMPGGGPIIPTGGGVKRTHTLNQGERKQPQ